jgi:hypothetical protein
MLKENRFLTVIVTCVTVPGLVMFLCSGPAKGQSSSANYAFLVASGFLCDPGGRAACPAEVRSADGDSYQMSGAGTFNTQNKSVTAAGTFAHQISNGTVIETGVWIVSQLVSFDSYGIAPGALMVGGSFARPPFGPKPAGGLLAHGPMGLSVFSNPMPTGGLAVFRIRLLPMSGPPRTSVLQVNCPLGNVSRERPVEGIRLTSEMSGTEYSEEVSGRAIFLLIRPEVSTPAKTPPQETAPDSAKQPGN